MPATRAVAALAGLVFVVTACGSLPSPRPASLQCDQAPSGIAGSALAAASVPFGLALTRQLVASGRTNVFTSPLSAQLVLAMTAAGARGTTQRAMLDAIGLTGLDGDGAAAEANALMASLASKRCATVEFANGVWARRGLTLDPGFVRTVREAFQGETAPLDAGSAKAINDWVSRKTHGKIPSILDRVTPDLLLYLVNATYFHADWATAFGAGATRQAPFHRAAGGDVQVPLMDRRGDFLYGGGPDYQAVALPYLGGAERMVVVLPRSTRAPADLAAYLDPARFRQVTGAMGDATGELRLPRFSLDSSASLLHALRALGMGAAFDSGADFSGIAPSCARACAISEVKQRAKLQVDEHGTTAAAATDVAVATAARLPFQMVVDHPFLLAIEHVPTHTLLFSGVVGDPAG